MKTPSYTEKFNRAVQQHEAVEKAQGQPGPKFNQYLKTRKAQHKAQGGKYATK